MGGCAGILNEVTPKAILKEAVGAWAWYPQGREEASVAGVARVKWRSEEMTSKGNRTVLGRALKVILRASAFTPNENRRHPRVLNREVT